MADPDSKASVPAGTAGPAASGPGGDNAHTGQGAPTDEAHRDAGDGSLTGSVPAGLTVSELEKQAEEGARDDGGTG